MNKKNKETLDFLKTFSNKPLCNQSDLKNFFKQYNIPLDKERDYLIKMSCATGGCGLIKIPHIPFEYPQLECKNISLSDNGKDKFKTLKKDYNLYIGFASLVVALISLIVVCLIGN